MDKRRFGMFIFIGLLCGAALGAGLGQAWLGALIGAAVGWFMAAAVEERTRAKNADEHTEHPADKP